MSLSVLRHSAANTSGGSQVDSKPYLMLNLLERLQLRMPGVRSFSDKHLALTS